MERYKAVLSSGKLYREVETYSAQFFLLLDATIQYLQNVKATFEEADNALGRT